MILSYYDRYFKAIIVDVGEATQYNSNQLPVKFVPRGLRAFVTNEQFSISNDEEMIVEYKCK